MLNIPHCAPCTAWLAGRQILVIFFLSRHGGFMRGDFVPNDQVRKDI